MAEGYLNTKVESHERRIGDLEKGYHNLDTRVVIGERDREQMTQKQKELENDNTVLKEGLQSIDKRLFQIITLGVAAALMYMVSNLGLVETLKTLF